MKKQNTGYKFYTIPNGLGFIAIGYSLTIITAIIGLCVLPQNTAFGIWLFTLVGILYTIYAYNMKCSNFIVIDNEGLEHKGKKYAWEKTFITMYCPGPNLLRNTWDYFVFFENRYLTEDEIMSKEIRKKGAYMALNQNRATILLSLYDKPVKITNRARIDKQKILLMVQEHNSKYSEDMNERLL